MILFSFRIALIAGCLFFTQQISAQSIRAYFTQSVDNSVSSITDAVSSHNLEDTICAFIDGSSVSVDIAVWDNGSAAIVASLNAAVQRGVVVRYITSSNSTNTALSGLSAQIPVLERNSGATSNVMHNKFVVIDQQRLLTGSMNFGMGSMQDDYNNIVIIEDVALAQTYTTEFNEMWGTSGAQPNLSNSKFGPDKTDNTTHLFTVGSTTVESRFSPTDNTTQHIVDAINSADYTLDIAMFTFINNDIGDAVVAAKNRGVYVRCIIENSWYIGSEYSNLQNAGIQTFSHSSVPFDFHHKYCIIDAFQASSDPMVVTGSHNWTNSAEDEYDENTLFIHDMTIAQQYTEEFFKRWLEMGGLEVQESLVDNILLFPNPVSGMLYLSGKNADNEDYFVCDVAGKIVMLIKTTTISDGLDVSALKNGCYYLLIGQNRYLFIKK